jgi:hypothetical protein
MVVGVTVAVAVAESVGGAVHVAVIWFVCVTVGVEVCELKTVCVRVADWVAVYVGVEVGVDVAVAVWVKVRVAVSDEDAVKVALGVKGVGLKTYDV